MEPRIPSHPDPAGPLRVPPRHGIHNNPWIVCGEAVLGRGNEAFDIYKRICPAYLEEDSEVHETEPYVYAQTVTGRASGEPGHAKNSWLTGTASWTFVSISQAILGLPESVVTCAGAGDNAAAAVGTGTVGKGGCNISLGTSGTIFISSDKFGVDPNNALHSFAHADGGYHLMGCMLSAASCNKWWQEDILGTTDYMGEQAKILPEKLGRNHVYFLPYLMGGRSPINDTSARGTFIGLTMDTSRADMLQAVLEGVAFAIRDSFEVAWSLGVDIPRSNICGGSKSPLWKTVMANVLGIPLDIVTTEQGPGYGGAILAMVATGQFPGVRAACDALVSVADTVEPDAELTALYEERYRQFRQIYPACKTLFGRLCGPCW